MNKFVISQIILIFCLSLILTIAFPVPAWAACPASYDTVVRVDASKPGQNLCTANSNSIGFNTLSGPLGPKSVGGQCGDFSCSGKYQTCVISQADKCYVGNGSRGFNSSGCTVTSPLVQTTCPKALTLLMKAVDSNGDGLKGVTFNIRYAMSPNNTTDGYTTSVISNGSGIGSDTTDLYSGDSYIITPIKPGYTFSPAFLKSGSMNTSWACGSQTYQNNQNAPCTFTATGLPTVTISGKAFVDYENDGSNDGDYSGGVAIVVTDDTGTTVGSATTDNNGNYTIPNIEQGGQYIVTARNTNAGFAFDKTTVNPQPVSTGAVNVTGINFGLTPLYQISGNVYVDQNKDQLYEPGTDALYTQGPIQIAIKDLTTGNTTNFSSNNGMYTSGVTLFPGSYSVSYLNLPSQSFVMSYLPGSPPAFRVTVGKPGRNPHCDGNGYNMVTCDGLGYISNLDFGIKYGDPWFQSICGDMRIDNGFNDQIPQNPSCGGTSGPFAIMKDPLTCPVNPGLPFLGNTDSATAFGNGSPSVNNFVAGGVGQLNQESFSSNPSSTIKTSFSYVAGEAKAAGISPQPIGVLTAGLQNGIYLTNGDLFVGSYTFLDNKSYIILVNGDLHISGNIIVPAQSTVFFSVEGNILIDPTVTSIDGIYSADRNVTIGTIRPTNTCVGPSDVPLHVSGSLIINAALNGGQFINKRDLCSGNLDCPSLSIAQRPYFILNTPTLLKGLHSLWGEVTP